MFKRILSVLLCIVMILSFSVMSFADVEDDLKAFQTVGETIYFGHYEQDNDLSNGKEPIEWIVLEVQDGKSLLLSKKVLEKKPYNDTLAEEITWENCTLRKWLNGSFISLAFNEIERGLMVLSIVDNSESQDWNIYSRGGSNDTEDFLFLLSYAEAKAFFDSNLLSRAEASAAVKANRNRSSYEVYDNYAVYWLRSPGYKATDQIFMGVHQGFTVNNFSITDRRCGVRPAFWIDLDKLQTQPDILETTRKNAIEGPFEAATTPVLQLEELNWNKESELITCGDTPWKLWLPEGFTADELTEADLADHYIGYYLRDDDIIAVQYSDNSASLSEWQKELINRGFSIEGLYSLNGSEAVLYRDEDADTMTASVLDGKGKLLEVTFYPYSTISEEADSVISSIQQEASKKRLSGASGNNKTGAGTGETVSSPSASPEEAYHEMVTAYKAGKYSDSYSYYEQAKGYQDADKYGNLLKARLCYTLKLTDSEIEELEKAIVNDISFADSKDVLVCNSAIAHYYLLGTWYSTNGTYIYEVKDNGGTTTTVPVVPRTGNYYEILNGTYWRYFDDKWDERTAVFDFKPISKSKMEIYSYQVKQSYTFNKTR